MAIPKELRKYTQPYYWYRRCGIPEPLLDVEWDDLIQVKADVVDYAIDIVNEIWIEDGGWQGIALFGKPGRGKTAITVAMIKTYVDHWLEKQRFPNVIEKWPPAIFTTLGHYHDLGFEQMRREQMVDKAPEEWNVLADEWMRLKERREFIREEVPVLVLDDVGKEHRSRSGYTESGFYSLMRGRWAKGLATSMTSNLTGKEFTKAYGEAQFSFLHEACLVLDIEGEDYRLVNA